MKYVTPIIYIHISNMISKEFNAKSVLITSVNVCQKTGGEGRHYCFRALVDLADGRSAVVEGIYSSGVRDERDPRKVIKPPSLAILKVIIRV
ncbi:MAG: hypothetical protein J7L12_04500 [Desulfurococcales archaeon]|nr:hypothetical protein [Desulfurococcales archaeon]